MCHNINLFNEIGCKKWQFMYWSINKLCLTALHNSPRRSSSSSVCFSLFALQCKSGFRCKRDDDFVDLWLRDTIVATWNGILCLAHSTMIAIVNVGRSSLDIVNLQTFNWSAYTNLQLKADIKQRFSLDPVVKTLFVKLSAKSGSETKKTLKTEW